MRVEWKPNGHNSYKICLLFECNRTNSAWPMFYDLWAAYAWDFFHVCGCVEGWMVENAEFYDIFVHYQYADCATAQYEPNMHTKRHMLHRTLNTAEPSDAYVSLYGQSQEALNARSTSIYSQFKPDMLHALGCFIFQRHFWQNMMIYGTSENCALLSMF